jgi:carboxyl-terminal processing protease
LKAGDYIVAIDGVSTEGMSLEAAVARIKGPAGTKVTLTVQRPPWDENTSRFQLLPVPKEDEEPSDLKCPHCGQHLRLEEREVGELEKIDITITRGHVAIPILEHRMLKGDIGYVWLKMFNDRAQQEVEQAIEDLKQKGMKGLILDLRRDPGGLLDMAVKVASQFVPKGPIVYVKERGREPEPIMAEPEAYLNLQVPLVVLVDHQSASASEIVAGAVQDYGIGTIVGEKTYGKGLVQTVLPLSDHSALVITTAKYLTPKHRDINEDGIEPDVQAPLPPHFDMRKFGSEKDPQIQKAIEVIQQRLEGPPTVVTGEKPEATL